MSAILLDELGFVQLAAELASRAEDSNHPLHYDVRPFLGFDFAPADCHPEAAIKCQELYEANVQAVNARYTETEKPSQISFVRRTAEWSDLQLFKSLVCLRYQMAEGDVPESNIYQQLDKLIGKIGETLLSGSSEYDELSWGWPELKEEEPEQVPAPPGRRFRLGKIVATPAALETIKEAGQDPRDFIRPHAFLERGCLTEEDHNENLFSVDKPLRIFSAFMTKKDEKLWVITEADRSATTILLPSEY